MASVLSSDNAAFNLSSTITSYDTNLGPETEIVSLIFDNLCERCQTLCSRLTATLLQDEILKSSKISNLRKSLIAQFPEPHQSTLSRLLVYDDVKLSTSLLSTERRSTVETVSKLLLHFHARSVCTTSTSLISNGPSATPHISHSPISRRATSRSG